MPLQLEYPISRPYPGRYFTPIVLAGAFICIVALTILNVTLTGYETVTSFNPDYNITQSFWYHSFLPGGGDTPGKLCDPRVFNVGDSFTTNYSLFQWNVVAVSGADDRSSSLVYKGSTLESCDVTALYINGDVRTRTTDTVAVITCQDLDGFSLMAQTSFSMTKLAGKYSPLLGFLGTSREVFGFGKKNPRGKPRAVVLDRMITLAGVDLTNRMDAMILATNQHGAIIVSGQGFYPPCPASLGIDASCANNPPPVNINLTTIVSPKGDFWVFNSSLPISENNRPIITMETFSSVSNLIQTILASVKIDLGNPSRNNFLLNPSVLNRTLVSQFRATGLLNASESELYKANVQPELYQIQDEFPLNVEGSAKIQVVYSCRLQQKRSAGKAAISVLVATLSMFSSGWALFTLTATYWTKRGNDAANRCVTHHAQHRSLILNQYNDTVQDKDHLYKAVQMV